MNNNKYLKFAMDMTKQKPNNMTNTNISCPFCNKHDLKDILCEDENIIWLKNKYPVLENTFQTVIIETDVCNSNIAIYTKEHMRKLISFGVNKWLTLKDSDLFKSVIFFKNHGPLSGGSIRHPHMQIIGLKDLDYKSLLKKEVFDGILIHKKNNCLVNMSTKPQAGFNEFNVIIDDLNNLEFLADNIQNVVKYILNDFHVNCNSFNLFFYDYNSKIICKIVPRFITSPLFIGYSISQVSNEIEIIAKDIKNLYYNI